MKGAKGMGERVQPAAIPGPAKGNRGGTRYVGRKSQSDSRSGERRHPHGQQPGAVCGAVRGGSDKAWGRAAGGVRRCRRRVVDDELAEEGDGRRWDDHRPQWVAKAGRLRLYSWSASSLVSILAEGKPLWGGPCQKIEIEEIDVRPAGGKESEKDPEEWEKGIKKAGIGGAYIFSDGSLLESGNEPLPRLGESRGHVGANLTCIKRAIIDDYLGEIIAVFGGDQATS